jgi:hypothetical protein
MNIYICVCCLCLVCHSAAFVELQEMYPKARLSIARTNDPHAQYVVRAEALAADVRAVTEFLGTLERSSLSHIVFDYDPKTLSACVCVCSVCVCVCVCMSLCVCVCA